jgi:hypothetical protein
VDWVVFSISFPIDHIHQIIDDGKYEGQAGLVDHVQVAEGEREMRISH